MKDDKDKTERLEYLSGEKRKQEERKRFYLQEIGKLKKFLLENGKEIKYNEGWMAFHEKSIENHGKRLLEMANPDERRDQEAKIKFHIGQIENHHKSYMNYHKKEIEFLKKEIQIFEDGIKKCEEQLVFLNKKIKEI